MDKTIVHSYCIIALLLILPLNCHAENATNVFDIRNERNTVERYVAVVLFLNFIPQATIVVLKILRNKIFELQISAWIYRIFSVLSTFSFFVSLHLTFLLAMNRLIAICFPKFNAFFKSMKFYFLLIFLWLSGFGRLH
ncbi:unnamed protein product [Brugia timori]|uniref:G_PROTEIN_RECEP_F1_2 domain-containing protein n=1 Tax=Brugia timori TaxID=42155 RepID=A0A0R3R5E5_9BILA|nr:unnamed protein product [Brugia timori]